MEPRSIVCHNTANDASAENEIKYMISNNNSVSYHIAVDDKYAIQAIPFNRNAWHAGDGANGNGNRYGLGVEICYSKSGGSKYTQAEENAVYVMARLLYKYDLGIDALKQHGDFGNKNCPHRINDEGRWNSFKSRVNTVLKAIKNGTCSPELSSGKTTISSSTTSSGTTNVTSSNFTVKIISPELNIRKSASFTSEVVGVVKKGETYTITEVSNGLGRLKSGAGWISMGTDYVQEITPTSGPISSSEYLVKIVNCSVLNVRSGAGTNYSVVTTVIVGEVYTIVDEKNNFGKLKSGVGWISLTYTEKI